MKKRVSVKKKPTAVKKYRINQQMQRLVVKTDGTWSGAEEIPKNDAWVIVRDNNDTASYIWARGAQANPFVRGTMTFDIPSGFVVTRARLMLSVDNFATVTINRRVIVEDEPVARIDFFNQARTFRINPGIFRRQNNRTVITAFNFPLYAPRSVANPAGVAALLVLRLRRRED